MRKNSGFSLLELLVGIAIIAIMLSIGVPNLISWRQKAQLGGFARDVYGTFQKAKMEAVRQNKNITVSFDQTGCDYVIFIDESTPLNQTYNPPGEEAIHCLNKSPGVEHSFDEFPGSYIIFANNGLPIDSNGNLARGKAKLTMNGRESIVTISVTGNIKIEKYAH